MHRYAIVVKQTILVLRAAVYHAEGCPHNQELATLDTDFHTMIALLEMVDRTAVNLENRLHPVNVGYRCLKRSLNDADVEKTFDITAKQLVL